MTVNPRNVLDVNLTGHSRGTTAILGPLTLTLHAHQTAALTGPSGVGKTTLLRLIAGLEPAKGRITVQGRLAVVFQEPTLLPWRNALQNLCLATGIPSDEAETLLTLVGLHGLGTRFPTQLSLGQQRRLALARAFAVKPDLLLMDEPFVSLDPALAAEMMTAFTTLRAQRPLATLIVTHDPGEAQSLATRILRLSGTPATLTEVPGPWHASHDAQPMTRNP